MTVQQASILLSLVQGQDGQAWANGRTGWNKGDLSVCFWDGVLCDPSDQSTVTGIFLPNENYSGTLPTELGSLVSLKELSMPQNQIRGRIPKEISKLPHLETLNLAENEITGTIPPFAAASLSSIDLSHNLLAGTLDPNIGTAHKALKEIDIVHNKLTGPIPDSFSSAKYIDTISLSENRFSGTLPVTLGSAPNLRYLYLDNNFLMGTIPPEIVNQDSPLEELWLQENLLSGTIPAAIADLKHLFNFYIDGNKFTGSVPQQLCRKEINADFFEGIADDDEIRNYCDSIACESGFVSFEGVFPCSPCDESYFNPYLGRVGECIDMREDDILDDIYESAKGQDWLGGVNWQAKGIPKCSLTGITCDDNENIIGINLKGKGLRGIIPESIGFLRFLESLDLSDNELTGFIPSDLRWAPLEFLDITGNEFRGILPHELCRKDGINGNGENGAYECDKIACKSGFMSETGRESDGIKCTKCKDGATSYIGSKHCYASTARNGDYDAKTSHILSLLVLFFKFILITGTVALAVFIVVKIRKRLKESTPVMRRIPQNEDEGFSPAGRSIT